jgi:hypothetical protein
MTTDTESRKPPARFDTFLTANDISNSEAGRRLNVSHTAIIDWRTGRKVPSRPMRIAIARWMGAHETPPREGSIHEDEWETPEERAAYENIQPFASAPEADTTPETEAA